MACPGYSKLHIFQSVFWPYKRTNVVLENENRISNGDFSPLFSGFCRIFWGYIDPIDDKSQLFQWLQYIRFYVSRCWTLCSKPSRNSHVLQKTKTIGGELVLTGTFPKQTKGQPAHSYYCNALDHYPCAKKSRTKMDKMHVFGVS